MWKRIEQANPQIKPETRRNIKALLYTYLDRAGVVGEFKGIWTAKNLQEVAALSDLSYKQLRTALEALNRADLLVDMRALGRARKKVYLCLSNYNELFKSKNGGGHGGGHAKDFKIKNQNLKSKTTPTSNPVRLLNPPVEPPASPGGGGVGFVLVEYVLGLSKRKHSVSTQDSLRAARRLEGYYLPALGEKAIRAHLRASEDRLEKCGALWPYVFSILDGQIANPSAPTGCPACGLREFGHSYRETWARVKSIRLSYVCPECDHVEDSEFCFPARMGDTLVKWTDYQRKQEILNRQRSRDKWKPEPLAEDVVPLGDVLRRIGQEAAN